MKNYNISVWVTSHEVIATPAENLKQAMEKAENMIYNRVIPSTTDIEYDLNGIIYQYSNPLTEEDKKYLRNEQGAEI